MEELGAIEFMRPLSPQQQEFQSNQSDNFQSLDWPKVGRKRDRVVAGLGLTSSSQRQFNILPDAHALNIVVSHVLQTRLYGCAGGI